MPRRANTVNGRGKGDISPDTINRKALAERLAKLDGLDLPAPRSMGATFPSAEDPSLPDISSPPRKSDESEASGGTRKPKLSSRLASLTGLRMNVRPAFATKMASSESVVPSGRR